MKGKVVEWARKRGRGPDERIQGPEGDTSGSGSRTHSAAFLSWWASLGDLGYRPLRSLPRPLLCPHPPSLGMDGLQLKALPQLSAQVTQASAHSFKKLEETLQNFIHFYLNKNHSSHRSLLLWEIRTERNL